MVTLSGRLVKFLEHGALITGLCTGSGGDRLQVLREDGSESTLHRQRILFSAAFPVSLKTHSRKAVIATLQGESSRHRQQALSLQPAQVWKTCAAAGSLLDLPALARNVFGQEAGADHEAALLTALLTDRIHFKLQGACFRVHPPEEVERLIRRAEKDQLRAREIAECVQWLQKAVTPAKHRPARHSMCIDLLQQFVLFGSDAPRFRDIRDILLQTGLFDRKACFDLLVRFGVWDEDQNLLVQQHALPVRWEEDVSEEVVRLAQRAGDLTASRTDLTGLTCYSVDEPYTRDIDDAISFDVHADHLHLGIHITDATAYILPGSPLDREAARRGASLYLPEGKIPMLPPQLSEDLASLRAREAKPAISFLVTLSPDGSIIDWKAVLSTIMVARKLTYQSVDTEIAKGGRLARLHAVALQLRRHRLEHGASGALIPEQMVRVDRSKNISFTIRDKETPAQILVAECMILANYSASRLFADRRFPALFRRQAPPALEPATGKDPDLYELLARRRHFSRVEIDCRPGRHSSLGLESYTSVTSPLRKYLDLVTQRQLVALLQEAPPPCDARQLRAIVIAVRPVLARLALVEQERKRYWILKALKKRTGRKLPALVLDRTAGMLRILLTDYLLEASLRPGRSGSFAAPGTGITVTIEQVDPFAGSLKVRIA